jgi:hypothetical protein
MASLKEMYADFEKGNLPSRTKTQHGRRIPLRWYFPLLKVDNETGYHS